MRLPIYLDCHATTPVDPRVLEAMLPYFRENFGNPASRNHPFGWRAEEGVDQARGQIAELIRAKPIEIVFTSGATESNNLAIKGVAEKYRERGNHILTTRTEHRAVLDACRYLEKNGFRVTYLPVDRKGFLKLETLEKAMTDKTILISVLYANNEIGVIQPVAEIGKLAREHGIPFHVDAAQAVGKIPVDVERDPIDLLSLTAHKLYGPKGIGALYIRRRNPRVEVVPQMHGGGHERGFRSGTLNVAGIVGLGKACEICRRGMAQESQRLAGLRDRLKEGLLQQLDDVYVNGGLEPRLPHNLHLSFAGVDGESLLMGLDDVAVSSGSACTTANPEPSHVLRALGVRDKLAHGSLRFGLGRFTTAEEIDYAINKVARVVKKLRQLSSVSQKA